jgi:hypothetical protein
MANTDIIDKMSSKERIRSDVWERVFPLINPILKTDVGLAMLSEDLANFQKLYESLLAKELRQISESEWAELKYLQNRIVTNSRRIEKYLQLDGKGEK